MSILKTLAIILFYLVTSVSMASDGGISPPVKVYIGGEFLPAIPSESYSGLIIVKSALEADLSNFHLYGAHWTALSFDNPGNIHLTDNDSLIIYFSGTPGDSSRYITFECVWDYTDSIQQIHSFPVIRSIDLSLWAYQRTVLRGSIIRLPTDDSATFPEIDTTFAIPPAKKDDSIPRNGAFREKESDETYTVRVWGRVVYMQPVPEGGDKIGAHGVRIEIWEYNPDFYDPDNELDIDGQDNNVIYTDPRGYFDVTVTASDDNGLDIYLILETENGVVEVESAGLSESNYGWDTEDDVMFNKTTSCYFGDITPSLGDQPAYHILTNICRMWRWIYKRYGKKVDKTDVQWPEDPGQASWYNGFWHEIHITSTAEWQEPTILHEYGHHFLKNWGLDNDWHIPDYDNCICDGCTTVGCDNCGDPGHCAWCEENSAEAWGEGFPDWFSDFYTRIVMPDLGFSDLSYPLEGPVSSRSYEDTLECTDINSPGPYGNPYTTEGFVAALLRDIEDTDIDRDGDGIIDLDDQDGDGVADRTTWNVDRIFNTVTYDWTCEWCHLEPLRRVYDFIAELVYRYGCEDGALGETVSNLGYNIADEEPPASVTELVCTTPIYEYDDVTYTAYYAPMLRFEWQRAIDDCSGIDGYSIELSNSGPIMPDETKDLDNITSYVTPILNNSTEYTFNIRSLDNKGNWSTVFASIGPFYIRDPIPVDLEFTDRAGWDAPMVLNAGITCIPDICSQGDGILYGNINTWELLATQWNVSFQNIGDEPASPDWRCYFFIDDDLQYSTTYYDVLDSWGTDVITNRNTFHAIKGGRHTAYAILDHLDILKETDEGNNYWGKEYTWTPYQLTPNIQVMRSSPPSAWGGLYYNNQGPYYLNCDGFRLENGNQELEVNWHAIMLKADDNMDDYDLRFHFDAEGVENDFAAFDFKSSKPPGFLEIGLINGWTLFFGDTATPPTDIGIVNMNDQEDNTLANSTLKIKEIIGQTVSINTQYILNMQNDEWALMLDINDLTDGPYSVYLDISPSNGLVYAYWMEPFDFFWGSIAEIHNLENVERVAAGADGIARLDVDIDFPEHNGLLLFRNPKDWSTKGISVPVTINLLILPTLPDAMLSTPENWHSPLVPNFLYDPFPEESPEPDRLIGNFESTFVKIAVQNLGPLPLPPCWGSINADGEYHFEIQWDSIPEESFGLISFDSAFTIPGGRHTLSAEFDIYNEAEESDTANNYYGEQYVWSPIQLDSGITIDRPSPPNLIGGWSVIGSDEPAYFNCDGIRSPLFSESGPMMWDGYWGAIASVPSDSGGDIDLLLHEAIDDTKTGFQDGIQFSGWGPDQSDFLLVNFNKASFRKFDVGVIRTTPTISGYSIHSAASKFEGTVQDSLSFSSTLGENQIVCLHEFALDSGLYKFTLQNDSGNIDWGISLHPDKLPFISKGSALYDGSISWINGSGEGESIVSDWDIIDKGFNYYCLAVWRTGNKDYGQAGAYTILIEKDLCLQEIALEQYYGEAENDWFGYSVAGGGDLNGDAIPDYIIGAPKSDNCYSQAGVVYVYDGSTGSLIQTLCNLELESDAEFGSAVAIIPDVNNDNICDIVIGAPNANENNTGSVLIVSGNNYEFLAYFVGGGINDRKGESVASAGDVNQQGVPDIIFGQTNHNETGAAFVISGETLDWQQILSFYGENAGDKFGQSIDGLGDINGDNHSDIIIGAPYNDFSDINAGRVYIYSGIDGSLIRTHEGEPSNVRFGLNVASAGDINKDGINDYIIGQYNYNNNSGRAYLFSGLDGDTLNVFDGTENELLGIRVAGAGDINGDGYGDILISASGNDDTGIDQGVVYIYSGFDYNLIRKLYGVGYESGYAGFGLGLADAGDLNEDCFEDVIVGAPLATPQGGYATGISFVYKLLDMCNYDPVCPYVCGDVNGDETVNILDITFLIVYLYKDGPAPSPLEAGNVNSDGSINILDITYLITYLYKGGPEPGCI